VNAASRKPLPPPDTGDVLSRRFSLGQPAEPAPAAIPPAPHTRRTPHTPPAAPAGPSRAEPEGMVRRTYYYGRETADALAAAVDRIHYDSRGRIPKHVALNEIIAAGVAQVDEIAARLNPGG
jgi:hypothetical protein